jgi:hypothetical protein
MGRLEGKPGHFWRRASGGRIGMTMQQPCGGAVGSSGAQVGCADWVAAGSHGIYTRTHTQGKDATRMPSKCTPRAPAAMAMGMGDWPMSALREGRWAAHRIMT